MREVRRVVTGHDADGKAIFVSDGPTTSNPLFAAAEAQFFEVWNTNESPAKIQSTEEDPTARPLRIPPGPSGSVIRVVDIHPMATNSTSGPSTESSVDIFAELGSADASTAASGAPHHLMHRTETIDYGIILEGEITLVLDQDETHLKTGDIVIQRGTNHAWDNRSDRICRIAFILLDGAYDVALGRSFSAVAA